VVFSLATDERKYIHNTRTITQDEFQLHINHYLLLLHALLF